MNLSVKRVAFGTPTFKHVRALYLRAFPAEEQFPLALLQLYSNSPRVDFLAFYDVGQFAGMAYAIRSEETVFVLYLAINDQLRGRGYGSAILSQLKERYAPLPLSLNIEPVDATAPNYVERAKRLAFYLKNGFHQTGYALNSGRMTYHMLSTARDFDPSTVVTARPKWMPAAEIFSVETQA